MQVRKLQIKQLLFSIHLISFLFTAQLISGQIITEGYDLNKLDNYFEKARNDWNIPGLAIGIVKDGKLIFAKGYGIKDIRTKEAVDENTIFGIASNSKAFTSTAIMQLVEQRKINLDDKVIDYLPYFELYDPYVTREITVRDLLCHRSGYKTFSGDLLWYATTYSREEVLKRVKYLKPDYSFRSKYGYSNIMFLAAGEIVKKVSGITWDEYVNKNIFEPLEMHSTNTSIFDKMNEGKMATPHFLKGEELLTLEEVSWDNMSPAGGINSSVKDMSNWIIANLNRGKFKGTIIFSTESSAQMWTPHTINRTSTLDSTMHFRTYGLGWDLFDYHGRLVVNHSGGLDGMISHVAMIPEENLGMVILTNSSNYLPSALMYVIINHFLNLPERDFSAEYLSYINRNEDDKLKQKQKEEADRYKKTKPSLKLEDYVGVYGGDFYGNAEITIVNKELKLNFIPTPVFKASLYHWHFDTFELKFDNYPTLPNGKVQFFMDTNGKITEFKVDVPNPDFDFTELEFKKINP